MHHTTVSAPSTVYITRHLCALFLDYQNFGTNGLQTKQQGFVNFSTFSKMVLKINLTKALYCTVETNKQSQIKYIQYEYMHSTYKLLVFGL